MSRAIGTSARFLTQRPKSTMGERKYQVPPEKTPNMQTFHRKVRDLMEIPIPVDDEGRLMPPVINLCEEAKKLWISYFNKIEEALKPDIIRSYATQKTGKKYLITPHKE